MKIKRLLYLLEYNYFFLKIHKNKIFTNLVLSFFLLLMTSFISFSNLINFISFNITQIFLVSLFNSNGILRLLFSDLNSKVIKTTLFYEKGFAHSFFSIKIFAFFSLNLSFLIFAFCFLHIELNNKFFYMFSYSFLLVFVYFLSLLFHIPYSHQPFLSFLVIFPLYIYVSMNIRISVSIIAFLILLFTMMIYIFVKDTSYRILKILLEE